MWFFSNRVEERNDEKKWNNDVRPSYESVLWRFRTLKNIREGNVPKLRKVKFEKKLEIIPVSYKKGTSEVVSSYERCPSPSKTPPPSPKDMRSISPLVLRPHISTKKKRKKRKK